MEALEGMVSLTNKSVLDVGTGTGILSLAALLLGARSAVAFDIDGDAARNCNQNANLNQLHELLNVFQGTMEAMSRSARFDLILANIYGDIILKETNRLTGHIAEGGYVILSGLDYTDSRPVKVAMSENGLKEVSVIFLEEFVTQVWHRPLDRDQKEP